MEQGTFNFEYNNQAFDSSNYSNSASGGQIATNYGTLNLIVPQGWQCPLCKRANSPSVRQCDCSGGMSPSYPVYPKPWYNPYYPNIVPYYGTTWTTTTAIGGTNQALATTQVIGCN